MKKIFLMVLLALSMTFMLYAQEDTENSASGLGWDVRLGISFPFIGNFNSFFSNSGSSSSSRDPYYNDPYYNEPDDPTIPFGSTLLAFALSSVSLGGGVQYTIVPHFLAPGIYADLHFNLPSWLIVGTWNNWEYNFIILQTGIRLYNQFQLSRTFGLEPFFGFNNVYIGINKDAMNVPLMAAGLILKLGSKFGFEYCYNFSSSSNNKNYYGWFPSIHRIGFSWSLL
jgi:hypothetical protein